MNVKQILCLLEHRCQVRGGTSFTGGDTQAEGVEAGIPVAGGSV